jgi:uncharacterized repeat protein (TIGR01451 family)
MTVGGRAFRCLAGVLSVALFGLLTLVGSGVTASPASALETLSVSKEFSPDVIQVGGTTTLTFTIENPAEFDATGVTLVDTMPDELFVAEPNGATNTCGGTLDAPVPGDASRIALFGGTVPASSSCQFTVNVVGAVAGVFTNTSDPVMADGHDPGNRAEATLTVVGAPTISKQFGAPFVQMDGVTSLTFTVTNPYATTGLSGVHAVDFLPAGLRVAIPNGATNSCGGTLTAPVPENIAPTIELTDAELPAGASCTFAVNVRGRSPGLQHNTVLVQSIESGPDAFNEGSADIEVVSPPSIAQQFAADSIPLNGETALTFTITNPNSVTPLSGVGFTDQLENPGLFVSTPNGLTNGCGGAATAAEGSEDISLSGVTVNAGASCTLTVNVTGTAFGEWRSHSFPVTSTEAGNGNESDATLKVGDAPSISKTFGAPAIPLDGTTNLTFTITNSNPASLPGVGFTDNLPSGLVVSSPNGLTNGCGGTATATAGSGTISLSAGTVNANASCTLMANVTGTTVGAKNNTSGAVASTATGTGNTASASLTVVGPPSISKVFGAGSVPLNGSTSLTFTVSNPNPGAALSGVGFSDTLPAGLVVATPNGLSNSCGGTSTAVAGSGSVSLSGVTVGPGASCTLTVNVAGTTAGDKNNTSGAVTSTEGGTGNTASASLTVVGPPSISKVFGASPIPVGGSTSLSFTITNTNAGTALSGVAFSDALPSGLVVATPNGLTGSCGGGTITATAGSGAISLLGATLPAGTSCTFAANVTGTTPGVKANTSGAVTSTEGGTGNTASAHLTVGYNVLGFFSPLPKDTYMAGATIPVKFALADTAGTRIPDAEAQAIAASCRAKVRLDSGSPGCATYNATTDTFQFNLKTPKNLSKGSHTITLDVLVGGNVVSTKSTTTTIK